MDDKRVIEEIYKVTKACARESLAWVEGLERIRVLLESSRSRALREGGEPGDRFGLPTPQSGSGVKREAK